MSDAGRDSEGIFPHEEENALISNPMMAKPITNSEDEDVGRDSEDIFPHEAESFSLTSNPMMSPPASTAATTSSTNPNPTDSISFIDEIWENQRYWPGLGWKPWKNLQWSNRTFDASTASGSDSLVLDELTAPEGWSWIGQSWVVDRSDTFGTASDNEEGWLYSASMDRLNEHIKKKTASGHKGNTCIHRRRRWTRVRTTTDKVWVEKISSMLEHMKSVKVVLEAKILEAESDKNTLYTFEKVRQKKYDSYAIHCDSIVKVKIGAFSMYLDILKEALSFMFEKASVDAQYAQQLQQLSKSALRLSMHASSKCKTTKDGKSGFASDSLSTLFTTMATVSQLASDSLANFAYKCRPSTVIKDGDDDDGFFNFNKGEESTGKRFSLSPDDDSTSLVMDMESVMGDLKVLLESSQTNWDREISQLNNDEKVLDQALKVAMTSFSEAKQRLQASLASLEREMGGLSKGTIDDHSRGCFDRSLIAPVFGGYIEEKPSTLSRLSGQSSLNTYLSSGSGSGKTSDDSSSLDNISFDPWLSVRSYVSATVAVRSILISLQAQTRTLIDTENAIAYRVRAVLAAGAAQVLGSQKTVFNRLSLQADNYSKEAAATEAGLLDSRKENMIVVAAKGIKTQGKESRRKSFDSSLEELKIDGKSDTSASASSSSASASESEKMDKEEGDDDSNELLIPSLPSLPKAHSAMIRSIVRVSNLSQAAESRITSFSGWKDMKAILTTDGFLHLFALKSGSRSLDKHPRAEATPHQTLFVPDCGVKCAGQGQGTSTESSSAEGGCEDIPMKGGVIMIKYTSAGALSPTTKKGFFGLGKKDDSPVDNSNTLQIQINDKTIFNTWTDALLAPLAGRSTADTPSTTLNENDDDEIFWMNESDIIAEKNLNEKETEKEKSESAITTSAATTTKKDSTGSDTEKNANTTSPSDGTTTAEKRKTLTNEALKNSSKAMEDAAAIAAEFSDLVEGDGDAGRESEGEGEGVVDRDSLAEV